MHDSVLFTSLCRSLRQSGWNYERVPEREVAALGFETKNGRIDVMAQAFAPIRAIGLTSETDLAMAPHHRLKLAELLMRTNLELTIGNFEMNWDTLRVFYRTTNLFVEEAPASSILAGMVHAAVAEMDRMIVLCRELNLASETELAGYDIGRLLRRPDLFPTQS